MPFDPKSDSGPREGDVVGTITEDGRDQADSDQEELAPIPEVLPLLGARRIVMFPGMVLKLTVGRPASRRLLEESLPQSKIIGVFEQRDPNREDPDPDNLPRVGVAGEVLKFSRLSDGTVSILISFRERIAVRRILATRPYIRAEIEILRSTGPDADDKSWQALVQQLRDSALELLNLLPDAPGEASAVVREVPDGGQLADLIAGSLELEPEERQALLEELNTEKRVRKVLIRVNARLEMGRLQKKIQEDVAAHFTDAQRRSFLRQQLKTIQRELGEEGGPSGEQVAELKKRLEAASLPEAVFEASMREIDRLEHIHPASPEYSWVTAYLETIVELPWNAQVIFLATANFMDPVPVPLRDRMEVIELSGYTDREKVEIARRFLLPRQLRENGVKPDQAAFSDEALERIRADYTLEAGVRELERQIGAVCRSLAFRIARGETGPMSIDAQAVSSTLGPPRYVADVRLKVERPGVVTGLAWTPSGGKILPIEALLYPGTGSVVLTGQIGEVMKESAQAAFSLVKSRAGQLGLPARVFQKNDLHIHVPAGAIPKDGPSAGIAMFTAIASVARNRPVRTDLAMTGEISLRGLVLPIGGLKEKCLAAMRAGLLTVVHPRANEKDVPDLPDELRDSLELVAVDDVDPVRERALHEE